MLRPFADPQVAGFALVSDINPNRLPEGYGHTLFVSAPIHEQERLRPLLTALM